MLLIKTIVTLEIAQAIYVRYSTNGYYSGCDNWEIMCLIGVIAALAVLPTILLVKLFLKADDQDSKIVGFAILFVIIAAICFTGYGAWEGWWTDKEGLQFWAVLLALPYVLIASALLGPK